MSGYIIGIMVFIMTGGFLCFDKVYYQNFDYGHSSAKVGIVGDGLLGRVAIGRFLLFAILSCLSLISFRDKPGVFLFMSNIVDNCSALKCFFNSFINDVTPNFRFFIFAFLGEIIYIVNRVEDYQFLLLDFFVCLLVA